MANSLKHIRLESGEQKKAYPFMQGGGEMGELTRNFDWSKTLVGSPDQWPASLRITVSNLLRSKFPMFLWWGKDMIQFYNDAYRPSLGNEGKHPSALGQNGKDCWPEIWDIISPLHRQVETTGEATWMEDQLVPIYRNGKIEDVYWTYSYSSVLDDAGNHAGILVTCMEVTEKIKVQLKIKESEAKLKAVIQQAPLTVIIALFLGPELIIDTPNKAFLETVAGGRNVEGFPLKEVLPLPEGEPFLKILDQVYATGQAYQSFGTPVETMQNGKREISYFNISFTPLIDLNGEVYAILDISFDVTEQIIGRQLIEESEARFRNMVEQAPVAVTLTRGKDLVIESINAPMLQIINKKNADDVLGKKLIEVLPEVEDQFVHQKVLNVLNTGNAYRGKEVPVELMIDNVLETRYFDLAYTPIIESNEITSVLHTAVDVTDQVNSRIRIEEGEARFRTMAESTPALISVGDEAGNSVYFNKAWTKLTGRSMQNLLEIGWTDLLHPEDRERYLNMYVSSFKIHESFTGEFRVLNPKREYCWVLAHGVARFDGDGKFLGYISTCTDITQNKIYQHQLQTTLEQARLSKEAAELGTFDMDLEKNTMHWDDRCRTLFGISHHDIVTYEKDFVEGLHPDDRARILKVIDKSFIKSVSNGDYDVEYRTVGAEDSVIRWIRAKGKVYFTSDEKPVRFIGSVLDITQQVNAIQKIENLVEERTRELAEANDTLKRINSELQRSNANLEEFAHAASHDLKEPIRKIHFFTHLLKDQLKDYLTENDARAFGRIENASQRMGNLIDDLLLYSHVSQRPQETENIDLNQKLKNVLEDLELDIEEKKAVIRVGKLPVVKGYRRQLQQLFQNLISNALKYSKENEPPRIDITAEQSEADGTLYYVIKVADNGIGFDQKYADKIFQMFSRLHGKHEYSGTGVGLSIVKKVMENHNGFVKAESESGKGSIFKIYLPAE